MDDLLRIICDIMVCGCSICVHIYTRIPGAHMASLYIRAGVTESSKDIKCMVSSS